MAGESTEKKARKKIETKVNKTVHASPGTAGKVVVCNVNEGKKK